MNKLFKLLAVFRFVARLLLFRQQRRACLYIIAVHKKEYADHSQCNGDDRVSQSVNMLPVMHYCAGGVVPGVTTGAGTGVAGDGGTTTGAGAG